MMELILAILVLLIVTAIIWRKNKLNYWKRRQIDTISFRTVFDIKTAHVAFSLQKIYQKLKAENKPYIGTYNIIIPVLVVTDLDLLKNIYMNDFESFPDRGLYSNPHNDPLSMNLVRLSGDMWKKIRQKLTPTFTSGKMKMMFPTVVSIGEHFVDVMGEYSKMHNTEVEVRDLCARFTTDVIGSVAFGLDCNSLNDPKVEFRVKGDKVFYTTQPFMDILSTAFPNFFSTIRYRAYTTELINFYSQIVQKNVEYREKHQIKRNDFLDLLIELKNNKEGANDFYLQMRDVIAQAFVFFVGGFETSSSTMSFALHELALNPDVQEKARENVKTVLQNHKGEFTYEALSEMHYIKQVVQETLRKDPVAPTGRRVCRKKYKLPGTDKFIDPGVHIYIPTYAIHHDPEYYPDPEIFKPERFAPTNKEHRHPMSYMPFGAGPRSCIAERFGMMQTMTGIALLLTKYKFSPCSKTSQKLRFDPVNVRVFNVKEGIYLKVEKIQ